MVVMRTHIPSKHRRSNANGTFRAELPICSYQALRRQCTAKEAPSREFVATKPQYVNLRLNELRVRNSRLPTPKTPMYG